MQIRTRIDQMLGGIGFPRSSAAHVIHFRIRSASDLFDDIISCKNRTNTLLPDFGVETGDSNDSCSIGDSDRADGDMEHAENGGISSSKFPSITSLPSSDPLNGDRYPSSSDDELS
uniref:Uncharacterized protein n=1 Tax=Anopheles culicifacies TaxID=139723 RepID=A0A182MRV4_9DIPT